jgi:hypothetical protein
MRFSDVAKWKRPLACHAPRSAQSQYRPNSLTVLFREAGRVPMRAACVRRYPQSGSDDGAFGFATRIRDRRVLRKATDIGRRRK